MTARVDHLVVAAAQPGRSGPGAKHAGRRPGPGGNTADGHAQPLLRIATVDYPARYFEIIACSRAAAARGRRWFDLDDEPCATRCAQRPRLLHFVASVPDVRRALAAWHSLGLDRGAAVPASRMTPRGLLHGRSPCGRTASACCTACCRP
jgi:hypothetical protein